MKEDILKVALVFFAITVVFAWVAIWIAHPGAPMFVELVEALLSWEVLATGLAVGAAVAYDTQIRGVLTRLGRT